MRTTDQDPVLVGVDGSEQSTAAVRWGAREAARLHAPLHLVHTWLWPLYRVPLGPAPGAPSGAGLRAEAERLLADAWRTARSVAPGVPVETDLVVGEPTSILVGMSKGASRVVVGNRGLGGFAGLLLGSTGVNVSARAHCPVVVVRGADRERGPVVVGLDGSSESDDALAVAVEEATRRAAPLLIVHAWTVRLEQQHLDAGTFREAAERGERAGRELLDAARQQVLGRTPTLEVQTSLTEHAAAARLVELSQQAQLVVLGSHGAGALSGLLLGSTAHALIHHASCPVLVHRA